MVVVPIILLVLVSVLLISLRLLHFKGRLFLKRAVTIEVNGLPVQGEMLDGLVSGIVTRRDVGKEHSYRLLYEGDIDQVGDIGSVIDCHDWIAPRLPFLIATSDYPSCNLLTENRANSPRWPLFLKGGAEQFVTANGEVITIRRR
jgi:hypothetical protein